MLLKGCRGLRDYGSGRGWWRILQRCWSVWPITLMWRSSPYKLRTGLVVLERNYLEVYPYDKWAGKAIPDFEVDAEFMPTVLELKDGKTSKPNYLTEADLVTLMDKNGIGAYVDFLLM